MNTSAERVLTLVASVLYYIFAAFLGSQVITDANRAVETYTEMCTLSGPEAQAQLKWQETGETLSGGLYDAASTRQRKIVSLRDGADTYRTRAARNAWLLVAITGFFILPHLAQTGNVPGRIRLLTLQCSGVSFVCLLIGLLAPVMSIVAYKDLPVLGHIVFKYDSKSIVGTLQALLDRDRFLAGLVLLFSVIIPVMKLALTIAALFSRHGRIAHLLMVIGKWSMADVLLVAILLAVFSTGSDASTDSWLEPGLYFFAAYAILSMLASQALLLFLKSENAGGTNHSITTLNS